MGNNDIAEIMMTQSRIWDYGAPRKSALLNEHFVGVIPTKRVYRGYNVMATSPASLHLDIDIDSTGSSVLVTDQGVRVEETEKLLNVVTISPHATLDRIDWVVAAHEYTGLNNMQTYEVIEGTAGSPPSPPASLPEHKVLLATVYVPAAATEITDDLINISDKVVIAGGVNRGDFVELRPDPQPNMSNTVFINGGTYVKSDGLGVVTVADDVGATTYFNPVTGPNRERYDLLALDDSGVASIIEGAEAPLNFGFVPVVT